MTADRRPSNATDREGAPVKDDIDVESEFGFAPAVSATGATTDDHVERRARNPKRAGTLRRRIGAAAVLLGALASMGSAYATFAASSGAADSAASADDIAAGRQLYEVSCITCHGANLEGIKGQGPSLIGVGGAAVYFQVSTGRMPATRQGAYEGRKEAKFDELQTEQLAAYVESVGGGPVLPEGSLRGDDASIAEGGDLFRLNCASCHGTTFKGAPLSAGKLAPSLNDANDKQIVAAMLTGPENMPVFSDNQITPEEKAAIVAYVQTLKASQDPGGAGIDRIGPVSEAIVLWVGGVGAVMIAILWIGAKSR
jgi:ubiquinol-cytochrome c reductase cytochrome c subunit